ncbi:hypothetical protein B0H17DRAFT_1257426 [Mycena rosella]|uniref:F-box domain-containing protein n=1 Tax=Mycena rosella TaxID=1033263 RepID=A0AAD7CT99_MYCRO|nr:hypothetical protein B0H17DRAFT_1257426 [Mycena rosella]
MIQKIFVRCVSEDPEESDPLFTVDSSSNPAWRYIAFETPRLWSSFCISVGSWSDGNVLLGSQRLAEWGNRTKSAPLALVVQYRPEPRHTESPLPDIFLPVLARSTQWRNVCLRIPARHFLEQPLRSSLDGRLIALERLRIDANTRLSALAAPVSIGHVPSLHTVHLVGLPPTLISLPSRQLTRFTGESFQADHCLHVLRQTVSLVPCKFIQLLPRDVNQPESFPPLRNLKSLTLQGPSALSILRHLMLPALLELDFAEQRLGLDQHHGDFVSFLSRSSPPLKRLSLYRSFQYLIHSTPFLSELAVLKMDSFPVPDMSDLLHLLREPANPFLPNLSSIHMSVWGSPHLDYADVADTLEYRWSRIGGPRLEVFHVNLHRTDLSMNSRSPPNFRVILARLLDLVEQGMHISFVGVPRTGARQTWI